MCAAWPLRPTSDGDQRVFVHSCSLTAWHVVIKADGVKYSHKATHKHLMWVSANSVKRPLNHANPLRVGNSAALVLIQRPTQGDSIYLWTVSLTVAWPPLSLLLCIKQLLLLFHVVSLWENDTVADDSLTVQRCFVLPYNGKCLFHIQYGSINVCELTDSYRALSSHTN